MSEQPPTDKPNGEDSPDPSVYTNTFLALFTPPGEPRDLPLTDKKAELTTEPVTIEEIVEIIEAEKLPEGGIGLETAFDDISIPGAEPDGADVPTENDASSLVPLNVETLLPMLRDQIADIPGVPFHLDGSLDESKLNFSSEIAAVEADPTQPAAAESESVDIDLSGVDIPGAVAESDDDLGDAGLEANGADTTTPESTESAPFDSQDASESCDGQSGDMAQSSTDSSDFTENPSPAWGTSQNGSPVPVETHTPTSQGFRTSRSVDDEPTTSDKPDSSQTRVAGEARAQSEPKLNVLSNHIRGPDEMLSGPLHGLIGAGNTIGAGLKTIAVNALKRVGMLIELASVLIFICYLVNIPIALVFPSLGTPAGVTTIGEKLVFLGELGVIVIPAVVVAFTISMLIDGVCNQGERYKPSPKIQQV